MFIPFLTRFRPTFPRSRVLKGICCPLQRIPCRRSCPLPYFNFFRTVRVVPGIALLVRIESFTKSLQHQGSAAEVPVSPEGDAPIVTLLLEVYSSLILS